MMLQQTLRYLFKYVDFKLGLFGATVMGSIVYMINAHHGIFPALTAASKQVLYTLLFGGWIAAFCQRFIQKEQLFQAVLYPSLIAISANYLLHSLKGTPEPLLSTLPVVFLGPLGFILIILKVKYLDEIMKRWVARLRNRL